MVSELSNDLQSQCNTPTVLPAFIVLLATVLYQKTYWKSLYNASTVMFGLQRMMDRQQKVILSHAQIEDLGKGIQPSEPIFKEGSPLDRLFGRIRRVVPMIIGVPFCVGNHDASLRWASVDWPTRSSDG